MRKRLKKCYLVHYLNSKMLKRPTKSMRKSELEFSINPTLRLDCFSTTKKTTLISLWLLRDYIKVINKRVTNSLNKSWFKPLDKSILKSCKLTYTQYLTITPSLEESIWPVRKKVKTFWLTTPTSEAKSSNSIKKNSPFLTSVLT